MKEELKIIKDALDIAEKVYLYLEKIEPYEEHEMSPDTPSPDDYWITLRKARIALRQME